MGLLVENLKDRILFAIPKKGRLHEKCLELLAGALTVKILLCLRRNCEDCPLTQL